MPAVVYPSFILRGLKLIVRSDNNSILLPDCPCQRQIIPIQLNIWISHKFPIHNIHPTTVCGRQWETKSELSRESQSSLECWGKVLWIFYLLWSFFSSHVVFVALTSMFERPSADCWVLNRYLPRSEVGIPRAVHSQFPLLSSTLPLVVVGRRLVFPRPARLFSRSPSIDFCFHTPDVKWSCVVLIGRCDGSFQLSLLRFNITRVKV